MKTLLYETIICVDLRPFNPEKKDYGVKDYVRKLGFKPEILVFLNHHVDFLHEHKEVDDTLLNRMTVGQRGTPASFSWSKRDFYNLIQVIRMNGISPFLGILSILRSDAWGGTEVSWKLDEVLQTKRGERNLWGKSINPLKRLNDGSYYDDLLARDLINVLKDFNFDGYVAGDGMLGLRGPKETLLDTDFSIDMIEQFKDYSNMFIPDIEDYDQRADYIVENYFSEWVQFYVYRWGAHVEKLSKVLRHEGKKFFAIDAWSRNPEEMITSFGIDYRLLYEKGLNAVFIQAREANKWKKHREGEYAKEEYGVYTFLTHKMYEPRLKYYWAEAAINVPEFWNAVLDIPHVLERENYAYLWTTFAEDGQFKKVVEGVAVIWGNDLTSEQWGWLGKKWDNGYKQLETFKAPIGFTLLWNEIGIKQLEPENKDYSYRFAKLLNEGVCIQSSIHENELSKTNYSKTLKDRWFVTFDRNILKRYPDLASRIIVIENKKININKMNYSWTAGVELMKKATLGTTLGRVFGFENNINNYMLSLENSNNLYYEVVEVQVPFPISKIDVLPPRQRFSIPETQKGNITKVSLPPDGSIQIEVKK